MHGLLILLVAGEFCVVFRGCHQGICFIFYTLFIALADALGVLPAAFARLRVVIIFLSAVCVYESLPCLFYFRARTTVRYNTKICVRILRISEFDYTGLRQSKLRILPSDTYCVAM